MTTVTIVHRTTNGFGPPHYKPFPEIGRWKPSKKQGKLKPVRKSAKTKAVRQG